MFFFLFISWFFFSICLFMFPFLKKSIASLLWIKPRFFFWKIIWVNGRYPSFSWSTEKTAAHPTAKKKKRHRSPICLRATQTNEKREKKRGKNICLRKKNNKQKNIITTSSADFFFRLRLIWRKKKEIKKKSFVTLSKEKKKKHLLGHSCWGMEVNHRKTTKNTKRGL